MPDAYRVGSGSVTPDYPGGVPTPLADRPALPAEASAPTAEPTKQAFIPAPEAPMKNGQPRIAPLSSDVERTVIARVPPRDSYPLIAQSSPTTKPTPVVTPTPKDEYTSAVVTPSASYTQLSTTPAPQVAPPTPPLSRFSPQQQSFVPREETPTEREYAHCDEASAAFYGDSDDDWSAEHDLPTRTDVAPSRRASRVPRSVPGEQVIARFAKADKERRRDARAYRYEKLDERLPLRRERPKRRTRAIRGLAMFIVGFLLAILLAVGTYVGVSYLRTMAANNLAHSLDACSVSSPFARLASDKTSLTLVAYGDGANGLSQTDFRCILDEFDTPSSVRERMLITRAVDGAQHEEWNVYRVTWTYHPEDGLSVVLSTR
jgi:hypothetical protein